MMDALFAYVHYLAIIGTGAFLTAELIVCRRGLGADQVRLLPKLDIAFFSSALLALATGLIRLFFYAKGLGFYLPNPIFWVKMALYVTIALISIGPTMRFIRWSKALGATATMPSEAEVLATRRLIHLELMLLALLPLAAALMARGIGLR
jgi:putative membrane protein